MNLFKSLKLKNAPTEAVKVDEKVHEWLTTDPYLKSIDIANNLRKHSSGCAVFQKTRRVDKGEYETETLYLHKIIAEKFLPKPKLETTPLAGMKSDDKLDARIDNLTWRTRAEASRLRKTTGKSGYLGVYQESRKFRAVISQNGKPVHIGMFETAEEAAEAFNRESRRLFGKDAKLNKIFKPASSR